MNLLCFRADKTVVDSRYILHYFRSKVFRPKLEKFIKPAVNQASVSIKDIKSIEIELPPLEEQRRIAEVLDKADALRQKRRLALQKLDTLLQSVFLEMFGDPSSVQNRLISRPFGELILNENSKRIPVKSSDRDDMSGEYPYYGASGVIDYVDDYLFDGSRLLIGEDGANLLARSTPIAFIAHGKYWVNNHAHVLASNGSANLRFLEYVFSRIDLTPYITGSAQPKLNRANLDRIPIPSPPIELQDRFEHFYEKVEQIRRASRVARDNGDNFFRAMQQRAFKGELFKGSMPSVGFEP